MVDLIWAFGTVIFMILFIQVFPSVLGKALENRIKHGYDTKLEQVKAEWQASYATLQTSVDFLSTTQSELRTKVIESTETLWSALRAAADEYMGIRVIDNMVTPKEINEILSGESENPVIQGFLEPYSDNKSFTDKLKRFAALQQNETERLFVGDRLWILYGSIVSIHGHCGILIYESVEQKQYFSWKDNESVNFLIKSRLPEDVVGKAKAYAIGGPQYDQSRHLESAFLKEAASRDVRVARICGFSL